MIRTSVDHTCSWRHFFLFCGTLFSHLVYYKNKNIHTCFFVYSVSFIMYNPNSNCFTKQTRKHASYIITFSSYCEIYKNWRCLHTILWHFLVFLRPFPLKIPIALREMHMFHRLLCAIHPVKLKEFGGGYYGKLPLSETFFSLSHNRVISKLDRHPHWHVSLLDYIWLYSDMHNHKIIRFSFTSKRCVPA